MSKYPDCFPDDFQTRILPRGAQKCSHQVYRISKSGKIDRNAFLSTFEEIEKGLFPPKKHLSLDDPSTYSTSCCMDRADAHFILQVMMRHHPKPIIMEGTTDGSCGPSQITNERSGKTQGSHVDWWIYADAIPQQYFKEVENG